MLCSWCCSEQLLEQVALRILKQCCVAGVPNYEHNSLYVEVVPIFFCSEFCPVLYLIKQATSWFSKVGNQTRLVKAEARSLKLFPRRNLYGSKIASLK